MQIIVDGRDAVLKQGSSFDFIAENRLFSGSDSYTLTITFPLKDCPKNIEIFGQIHRSEIVPQDITFDCEIREKAFSRFGTLTITEISDIELKAQFLEGRSEQNFSKDFDEIFINELDLGSYPPGLPSTITPEQAWNPATTDYQAVAIPWVSADSGTPHNFADYNESTGKFSWAEDVSSLSWQPYLLHIVRKICEAVGYEYDLTPWEENSFLADLLVCNTLPNGWNTSGYARALPHWTVAEFFEKLELFLRGEFTIDHRARSISFAFSGDVVESTLHVRLESVVDEYTANIKPDGSGCEYIDEKNYAYKDTGHQLSSFYSCEWFLESFPNPATDERIYQYDSLSAMINDLKDNLSISDWSMNNPDISGGGNHRHPNESGNRKIAMYYVSDVDMFFAKRLISQTLDREHSSNNNTYYNSRYMLQPLNEFGMRENNPDSEDSENLEFIPACIDFSEDKYGFCLFLNFSSYSESSSQEDSSFLSASNGQINWVVPYGGKLSVQRMIEAGKKDGRSEYYDVIYLGNYWGYHRTGEFPRPMVSSVEVGNDGLPHRLFSNSLRLNGGDDDRWKAFHKIDRTRKATFKFLSDDIPNPRALFFIRGRRYICEKITATFTEDGMSQLLKGEFWPLLDD